MWANTMLLELCPGDLTVSLLDPVSCQCLTVISLTALAFLWHVFKHVSGLDPTQNLSWQKKFPAAELNLSPCPSECSPTPPPLNAAPGRQGTLRNSMKLELEVWYSVGGDWWKPSVSGKFSVECSQMLLCSPKAILLPPPLSYHWPVPPFAFAFLE